VGLGRKMSRTVLSDFVPEGLMIVAWQFIAR
jgi:hypothetical protein